VTNASDLVKTKIRNVAEVPLQHRPVARQADALAVIRHIVIDEMPQRLPVLPVKTVDITSVHVRKPFVCGDDPDMQACAQAARTIYDEVEQHWRATGCAGVDLYVYAAQRANAHGFRLNVDIKGHRVSDFPHAIYKAGDLGDFDATPAAGVWILEIQIAHPTRPFGAFHEDLLV